MATNSANTSTSHTGNGSAGPFSISFPYVGEIDVDVFVGGVLKTKTTHYTFTSATQITFTSGNEPSNGTAILIQRDTEIGSAQVDFTDGSVLTETDLDTNTKQLLFGIQELTDDYVKRDGTQTVKANLVFEGSTDDDNETTLAITNPTDDRTITLPDRSGTVITSGDTGTVTSTMIADGTILNADVNASAAIDGTKISPNFGSQNIVTSGTVDGRDVSADGSKLDGIDAGAKDDQTAAEIRTLVESASDSNVFTDADHSKLNAIEASATADQSDAEIRTAVENATDSNVFTDADHSKLNAIEANATQDQTDAEIRAAVEAANDSNVFTDADHTKLNAIEASADVTDATNVDAAGAVMNTDLGTKGQILVGDGSGDPSALSVGTNNYVLVADSNEATGVKWATVPAGSGMSNLVEDTTPQLGGDLDINGQDIVTTSNGDIDLDPNGTGKVVAKGNANRGSGQIKLNCEQNSHGVIIKGPPHSANADYTLTLPNTDGAANQVLKSDGSGNLDWVNQTTDTIVGGATGVDFNDNVKSRYGSSNELEVYHDSTYNIIDNANADLHIKHGTEFQAKFNQDGAVEIYYDGNVRLATTNAGLTATGTVTATTFSGSGASLTSLPAANLTGTLPAISATNLTNIPAANITGTLPAISATNLTNVPAANITGTLPAIDGSNLTGITAGAQGGGGESIFFESEVAMDNDYTITANHNALVAGPLTINATLTINSPSVVTIP